MQDFGRVALLSLVIISGYFLELTKAAELVINPTGEVLIQATGKGFGLTCQGEAEEDADLFKELKWFGPKGELIEGASTIIEVSQSGGALLLIFREPNPEDSGIYNCTATYDGIERLSANVQLIFYQDITWDDCPTKQALAINNDGKIRCRVSANPPAVVSWKKDGQTLTERYITESDGIKVTGVTEEDKGNFSIRAMVQQTGRFHSRTIEVEVYTAELVINVLSRAAGKGFGLTCQGEAEDIDLFKELKWFGPKGELVEGASNVIEVSQSGGALQLIFREPNSEDSGIYNCTATYDGIERPLWSSVELIFYQDVTWEDCPTKQALAINSDGKIRCRISANPPAVVSWKKDGQTLTERYITESDGIKVTGVTEEDKGNFSVRAMVQRTGRFHSRTIEVEVYRT